MGEEPEAPNDGTSSVTFSHTPVTVTILVVWCPCGLVHQVNDIEEGGMVLFDCACGRAATIEIRTRDV